MHDVKRFGQHVPATEKHLPPRGFDTFGGDRWTFQFTNGYGASVINDGYGGEAGEYELAVIGRDGRIAYDTPVTDDVLGWLTEDDVVAALDQIKALPDA